MKNKKNKDPMVTGNGYAEGKAINQHESLYGNGFESDNDPMVTGNGYRDDDDESSESLKEKDQMLRS